MFHASLVIAALLFAGAVVADDCNFEQGLSIPPQFQSAVDSFCGGVLNSPSSAHSSVPAPLSAFLSSGGEAELSSVCSCLLNHYPTSSPTCATKTTTVSVTPTFCTATQTSASASVVTVTDTVTKTASGATATDTITATITTTDTISMTALAVTDTVTATITDTIAASASTVTDTDTDTVTATFTDTITASASTVTDTVTTTITEPPSTVTIPPSTVTVTTPATPVGVDQNGCPAVDGDTIFGYVIHCDTGAGSGSFAAGTNVGYNVEDCASQCFDNPDDIDCLAATYTPPSGGGFSIIDGHLEPGTCTFYEFVSEPISATGIVLAVFDNTFSGRKA